MLAPAPNVFRWWFTNQTTPSLTPGTAVTPGASNVEGSATVLATAAQLTEHVYEVILWLSNGATSAANKAHLLDIGVDPAGGTSYDWRVQDLQAGGSIQIIQGGRLVRLPLAIPKGSQVACRVQGVAATAGTVRVWALFLGKPSRPEMVWAGTYAENLGTITNSQGPSVTPGLSAAEGNWTNIGTTTRRLRWLHVGLHIGDATATSQAIWMDVAINVGGTRQVIAEHITLTNPGANEAWVAVSPLGGGFLCDIPPGSAVDVRLSIDLATADTDYGVNLVGIG